ncbi:NAD(P)-binding protein [Thozetella sp. PMI_491]|nr:NAD(P)-binding protein [Thozetella sp. PMI_491]
MSKPVAIVTGAASGMGRAVTEHLLDKGYRVVLVDINDIEGTALGAQLGEDAMFCRADVSKYEEQAVLFSKAFHWGGGRLDVLAANAGIADTQSLYEENATMTLDANGIPLPLDLKTVEVDLTSVIQALWLFKFFARQNKSSKGGKVVITSSAAGFYGMETNPLYGAAKSGLVGLTRSVGPVLYKQDSITVNCICPAFVMTGLCPPSMRDTFPKEHITPMSTIIKAYDTFLLDDNMTGQCVEASLDHLYFREPPKWANESQRWLGEESVAFWEKAYPTST